jgi:hypothetical protein
MAKQTRKKAPSSKQGSKSGGGKQQATKEAKSSS